LLAAYTRDRAHVDGTLVRLAASEVFGRRHMPFAWPWAIAAAGFAAIALGTWGLVTDARTRADAPPPAVPATTAAARPAPDPASNPPSARTTFGSTAARLVSADPRPEGGSAAPPADAPGVVPLAELLADPGFPTDTDSAFAAIFDLWDARYDPAR